MNDLKGIDIYRVQIHCVRGGFTPEDTFLPDPIAAAHFGCGSYAKPDKIEAAMLKNVELIMERIRELEDEG